MMNRAIFIRDEWNPKCLPWLVTGATAGNYGVSKNILVQHSGSFSI